MFGGPYKSDWYDRNPLLVGATYDAFGVVPHGSTVRWTYTIPSNRKMQIEVVIGAISRATAAVVAGIPQTWNLMGSGPFYVNSARLFNLNAVGDRDKTVQGVAIIGLAGQTLSGSSFDDSTGGTLNIFNTFKGTEFDA